ncbi:ATP-binding cassette domain-containing protein [Granulosicoccus antarcticus]|uniref:2-aminoethylphosphonate import ATP-binding protein PhnT n=1 Tax=Granulosicoccus antarcticus IMCC3135 TaxID=1192854 RepID=A0A2Z2NYK1_9GAMM|nr:ATP-binding cassette domain-containing protein [Granulosicoccus antarcticus]ASJ76399.1 Putative 2-aminoethylphosphonate import ATP-binding protein PhnT [Granulosicoccus antarcticus IMCC3135]
MHELCVKDLSLQLPNGNWLIKGLSFKVEPGQVLALMGPSGSGKSSILSWLTGTNDSRLCVSGDVWLGPRQLTCLPTERRRLGLMLQQDYLFPHMSVGDNLRFGLRGGSRQERDARVRQSLEEASLGGMENRDPATLSGGQRARVSLVRTLLSDPCALLLDEPFSGLDTTLREQIRRFTWEAAAQLPVLLVTHDLADIPKQANILDIGNSQAGG